MQSKMQKKENYDQVEKLRGEREREKNYTILRAGFEPATYG